MNPNILLRTIRIYSRTTLNQMATITNTAPSTLSEMETNNSPRNAYKYYQYYAKQANIPVWVIQYIIDNEDINKLHSDVSNKVNDILGIYHKHINKQANKDDSKITNDEVKNLMDSIQKDLNKLSLLLGT